MRSMFDLFFFLADCVRAVLLAMCGYVIPLLAAVG